MALSLVVLLVFLALVADVGQFFLVRNRLQAAADSAVLAAAMDLAHQRGTDVARASATQYADENLQIEHQTNVTFATDRDVEVVVRTDQTPFFGALLGRVSVPISARARAGFQAVSSTRDTVPIIVPFQSIEGHIGADKTTTYNLGGEGSSSGDASRGFFWLADFSGSGAGTPEYSEWIINGYPNVVSVGMVANGEGMKAALDSALAQRMASDPSVIVPLYDYREAEGGNKAYHVVGFAEFVIAGFNFQGNPKTITGYFTTGTVIDGETTETPPVDYGVNAIRLKG